MSQSSNQKVYLITDDQDNQRRAREEMAGTSVGSVFSVKAYVETMATKYPELVDMVVTNLDESGGILGADGKKFAYEPVNGGGYKLVGGGGFLN